MTVEPTKKKSNSNTKWWIIGGVSAALILCLVVVGAVALYVTKTPKILTNILVNRTPKALAAFYNVDALEAMESNKSALEDLFSKESHASTTVIALDGEALGGVQPEVEITTAYVNASGEGQIEFSIDAGGGDAIAGGLYLDGAQIAFLIDDLMDEAVVLDMDKELDPTNKTLEERMTELLESAEATEDDQLLALVVPVMAKLDGYIKMFGKELPGDAYGRGNDDIDLMGESTEIKFVSITMDDKDFIAAMEVVLTAVAEDSEFEDDINALIAYMADEPSYAALFEEYTYADADELDVDLGDITEEMLEELEYTEFDELVLKIYHQGYTPLGYGFEYEDDYSDSEGAAIFYHDKKKGDQISVMYEDDDYSALEMAMYTNKELFNFSMMVDNYGDVIEAELVVEKTDKKTWEIEGKLEAGDEADVELKGEVVEDGKTTTGEFELEITDSWGDTIFADAEFTVEETKKDNFTVEAEASVVAYGEKTDVELAMTVVSSNNGLDSEVEGEFSVETDYDTLKVEFASTTEEIRKNREYLLTSENSVDFDGETIGSKVESTIVFGDEATTDLPDWSDSDNVFNINEDQEELGEFLEDLFYGFGY